MVTLLAGAHPWDGDAPLKIHYSIPFKHRSITERPPLGEIVYPPLNGVTTTQDLTFFNINFVRIVEWVAGGPIHEGFKSAWGVGPSDSGGPLLPAK